MKKLLLLCVLTLGFSQMSHSQQYGWTDISANLPESGNFNDVHVIGEEVWISGWNDGVFYSSDAGEIFQVQSLPENSGITSSIFMKNNLDGYVVTFLGNILKTDNGGTTWTTLHEPGDGLNSVHFPPNSDTGYACGSNGTVWAFDDASITDTSPPDNASNLQSIYFPSDNSDGKVCGETTIARYKNNTWNNLQLYDATLAYNSIFFTNDTTGWCAGINGTIILTVDGFSWIIQTSNTTETFNDVFFINSLEGWVVGYETLLHSVEGGVTWTNEATSLTEGKTLRAIFFTSENNGYVVGNDIVLKYAELSGIGEEAQAVEFEIYPNPVRNKFEVWCSEFRVEEASIELFDLNGRKLLSKNIRKGNENIEIDVSHIETGMYFCKISTDKKSSTKKLIIE